MGSGGERPKSCNRVYRKHLTLQSDVFHRGTWLYRPIVPFFIMYTIYNHDTGVRVTFPHGDNLVIDPCLLDHVASRTKKWFIIRTASGERFKLNAYNGITLDQDGAVMVFYNAKEIVNAWVLRECLGGGGGIAPEEREYILYFNSQTEIIVNHNLGLLAVDVQIKDEEDNEIDAEITFLNQNQLRVRFNPAATGMIRCSA